VVRDRLGQDIFGTNTHLHQITLDLSPAHPTEVVFHFTLNLGPGQYTITLGLHDKNNFTEDVQDWWNDSLQFEIDYKDRPDYVGVCPLPVHAIHVDQLQHP
jgi:lipopolysaccharide transport system ATP-binding protein